MPAAILLNAEDWGFGYFHIDEKSIEVFESKLGNMESILNKAVVIGQLVGMMR